MERISSLALRHVGPIIKRVTYLLRQRSRVLLNILPRRFVRNVVVFFRIAAAQRSVFTPLSLFTSAINGSPVDYFPVFTGSTALAQSGICFPYWQVCRLLWLLSNNVPSHKAPNLILRKLTFLIILR